LPVRHPAAHDLTTASGPKPGQDPAGEIFMSKPAELRDQTDGQLELQLKDVQNNLFRLRLQSETERLEAPSEIIKAKREIARIKTILRLREIEREKSVAAPVPAAR
jgi:large subunit ribosomal protein L29